MTREWPTGVADISIDEVLNGAPCGFVSTLPDGAIVYINDTMVSWLGQDHTALLDAT